MARNRDNSPVPQTCPMIDWVISEVNGFYASGDPVSSSEAQAIENKMEKIRQSNTELREWGNEEYKRAEELEKDVDYHTRRISQLESEIEDLKQEILELSK